MAKNRFTPEQLMDFVVVVTVCLAMLVVFLTACVFSLRYPLQVGGLGEYTIAKGTGLVGGPLVFLLGVLQLVYKRRRQREPAT